MHAHAQEANVNETTDHTLILDTRKRQHREASSAEQDTNSYVKEDVSSRTSKKTGQDDHGLVLMTTTARVIVTMRGL